MLWNFWKHKSEVVKPKRFELVIITVNEPIRLNGTYFDMNGTQRTLSELAFMGYQVVSVIHNHTDSEYIYYLQREVAD